LRGSARLHEAMIAGTGCTYGTMLRGVEEERKIRCFT
jgi:hypothetical protein